MEIKTEDGKDAGETPDAKKPPPAVGFGEMFKHADALDWFLIFWGVVGAGGNGAVCPALLADHFGGVHWIPPFR